MLDSVPTRLIEAKVFRLASRQEDVEFLRTQGFDVTSINEMVELLESRGAASSPEEFCNGPFRPKHRLRRVGYKTRFSDGSFPVFYGSLEAQTAETEVLHWFCQTFIGKPTGQRTAYYSRFACIFAGDAKDLRTKQHEWPKLTHDSDYTFCNALGATADAMDLDGLLAPSARKIGGTNVAVFRRRAISSPRDLVSVTVTYDRSGGRAQVTHHASPEVSREPT